MKVKWMTFQYSCICGTNKMSSGRRNTMLFYKELPCFFTTDRATTTPYAFGAMGEKEEQSLAGASHSRWHRMALGREEDQESRRRSLGMLRSRCVAVGS